jgi:hypothetical protein
VFGLNRESDSDPWADVAMKLVESGQVAPLINGAVNLLGNLLSNILPKSAQPQQPPAPAPQVPQQQPAPQVEPAQAQALPENNQQPQAAQPQIEQGPMAMVPVDALVYSLIAAMERQAPIEDIRNILNIACLRNPELNDSIDELLNLPVDQILPMLIAYHPPVAQMPHAKTWIESLMTALTAEGDDAEFPEKL